MSTRVLAGQKPDSAPPSASGGSSSKNSDQDQEHIHRRRRHTPEHHQDRFLRLLARILMIMGALMILWLLLRALGWI
jgi:hypothetical protein